jgi:hypothetical protein
MADKQTALVNSIADGVHAKMLPELTKLAEQIAKLTVSGNATLARLETLEATMASGGSAPKRTVRTGAATGAAKGGAKKPVGKKAAGSDTDKVTNALLFCRYMLANDLDSAQEVYGTEENLLEAEKDSTVAKRDKDKDPNGYWSAVGAALWKTVLSDEQKDEIRAQYNAWKEGNTRDGAEPQLDEDDA